MLSPICCYYHSNVAARTMHRPPLKHSDHQEKRAETDPISLVTMAATKENESGGQSGGERQRPDSDASCSIRGINGRASHLHRAGQGTAHARPPYSERARPARNAPTIAETHVDCARLAPAEQKKPTRCETGSYGLYPRIEDVAQTVDALCP